MTVSIKPQSSWRTAVSLLVRLAFAVGCFVLAAWGRGFCREIIESVTAPGPGAGFNVVAIEMSWLLFFGPFILLGLHVLVRAWKRFRAAVNMRATTEAIQVLPPLRAPSINAGAASMGQFRTHTPTREPFDDATRQRLDLFAARTAKVAGVVIGMLLVVAGLAGFLLAWVQGHRPPASGRLMGYFLLRLLVVCGISILLGAYILRETFARPDTGWLGPLRVFNSIVGHKLAQEEQQRRNQVSSPRKLPPDHDPGAH